MWNILLGFLFLSILEFSVLFAVNWNYTPIQTPNWCPYYRDAKLRVSDEPFISTDTFRSIANWKIDSSMEPFNT